MAKKTLSVITKQTGTPLEIAVVSRRLSSPTLIQPDYQFDPSDMYAIFIPGASFGEYFYWDSNNRLQIGPTLASSSDNLVFGRSVGTLNTTAGNRHNIIIGNNILAAEPALGSIANNVIIGGQNTCHDASTVVNSIIIGSFCAPLVPYSTDDVLIGTDVFKSYNGISDSNTAIGVGAIKNFTSGINNTAYGFGALLGATSAGNTYGNTAVGVLAMQLMINSSNNVALGHGAGNGWGVDASPNVFADKSIYIGAWARPLNTHSYNEIVIASDEGEGDTKAIGKGSYTTKIGTSDTSATYLYGDLYVNDVLFTGSGSGDLTEASLGTRFKWTAGLLDLSIGDYATDAEVAATYATNASVNTALGAYATNASVNTALGAYATNASVNSALGAYATNAYVDAQDASIVNTLTTLYLTEAESNAAYVYKAGDTMTGDLNISGADIITSNGTRNTKLGVDSLASADGSYNVAIGYRTLAGNAVGTDNTIVGCEAGNHMSGSFNSALGRYALGYYAAGNNNIGIGFQAGRYHSAGDNNIFIGYRTQGGNNTTQNEIVIGSGLVGKGSNTVNIGNTDVSATYLRGTLYVNDVEFPLGTSKAYVDGSLNTLRNDVSTAYLKINDASASYIKNLASIRSSSTNYTVALSDLNNFIEASGNLTVTFPNNLPAGFQTVVYNVGDGVITLNASTLYTTDSSIYIRQKYAAASALHKGSGVWFAFGNIQ